jgi:hypothetical protein
MYEWAGQCMSGRRQSTYSFTGPGFYCIAGNFRWVQIFVTYVVLKITTLHMHSTSMGGCGFVNVCASAIIGYFLGVVPGPPNQACAYSGDLFELC